MGRNSSGVRGGLQPGDSNWGDVGEGKGKGMDEIKGVQDLVKMKDPAMYRETKDAISRYHSVMGVRQQKIKLADLPENTYGVHATLNGKSEGIYLNKKYFNSGRKKVLEAARKGYESGWSTKTNKPLAHTVTHELAHATWNNHLKGANQKAAGIEIRKMYGKWLKDTKKKGYGEYATTNVNEFWAETVTKAVHGNADKYTRKAKAIVKKYKL